MPFELNNTFIASIVGSDGKTYFITPEQKQLYDSLNDEDKRKMENDIIEETKNADKDKKNKSKGLKRINPTISRALASIEEDLESEFLGPPKHNYDFINELIKKFKPNKIGHYSDNVKKDNHPTSPKRVKWDGDYLEITDYGLYSPDGVNYTMWGARDNGDGDKIMTYKGTGIIPEVTVTPNGNFIHNTYDNVIYKAKKDD